MILIKYIDIILWNNQMNPLIILVFDLYFTNLDYKITLKFGYHIYKRLDNKMNLLMVYDNLMGLMPDHYFIWPFLYYN